MVCLFVCLLACCCYCCSCFVLAIVVAVAHLTLAFCFGCFGIVLHVCVLFGLRCPKMSFSMQFQSFFPLFLSQNRVLQSPSFCYPFGFSSSSSSSSSFFFFFFFFFFFLFFYFFFFAFFFFFFFFFGSPLSFLHLLSFPCSLPSPFKQLFIFGLAQSFFPV